MPKKGGDEVEETDNHSTAGGTSRKKSSDKSIPVELANMPHMPTLSPGIPNAQNIMGKPASNFLPHQVGPPPSSQYLFGMPACAGQMPLPTQVGMSPQMQMPPSMGSQPFMYPFPFTTPDGRFISFYPGVDQMAAQDNTDAEADHTVKRSRLVWTDPLHKKFLEAVEHCGGIEHALPKAIMSDMKVMGLTRENVSSHLQKYRLRIKQEEEVAELQGRPSKKEDRPQREMKK